MSATSPSQNRPTAEEICDALIEASRREPYAKKLGLEVLLVEPGRCKVQMRVEPDMVNVFGITHGGAVFSLMDEAFQLACNAHGTTAYALNLSVTYVKASSPGDLLTADVREIASTPRTATYETRVSAESGELIAVGQALAYKKREPLPFVKSLR